MDKIIISGNLGGVPELKRFEDGNAVCNFSLCSNRRMRDGTSEKTWYSISVYGNQAENCNTYLKKGSKVLLEGRLKPNEQGNPHWYYKSDGTIGTTFNVTAKYVEFLDSKSDGEEVSF